MNFWKSLKKTCPIAPRIYKVTSLKALNCNIVQIQALDGIYRDFNHIKKKINCYPIATSKVAIATSKEIDHKQGFELAKESLLSGKAKKSLDALIELSN